MKIAMIQVNIEFGNPETNRKKMVEMIEKAAQGQPDIIVLPEMWNTSFSLKNLHEIADKSGEPTKTIIGNLAKKYHINIVAGSVADVHGDLVHNRLYVFDRDGNVKSHYDKAHLIQQAREHEFLTAGKSTEVFRLDEVICGAIICYDIRFPELARTVALKGAKVLFIPAQWPETRIEHWKALVIARAIENQMYVVAVNRIGSEFKADFPGKSLVVDPWGKILVESDDQEQIVHVEIDMDLVDRIRTKIPCFSDRNIEAYEL
ncbi:putative amidohydrolase [Anaerosolibacter carboniphilus]|uniref:Putative amidohydrolase n=1 Tax=Anaerosolibacter carboniphilus TaxID=1417629 RepID=A0A841L093_9FIRM|nr:carbon-nitrogen family hydrolase [Anaerosolibacter carboniphilus]MBB6218973.1 putative amidohydrolase [Anaerosolibacter carboniphilus]